MILTTVLLSACTKTTGSMAALDDRSRNFYGRGGVLAAATDSASAMAVPVTSVAAQDLAPAAAPSASGGFRQPVILPKGSHTSAANPPVMLNTGPVVTAAAFSSGWQWPVQGRVTEHFGKQSEGIANEGITIAAAEGTPIHAARPGEVAYIGHNVRDYGNIVILRHAGGDMTSYAHTSDIAVAKGQQVAAGQVLGHVGRSGSVHEPQLHFAMRSGGRAIDPLSKLPSQLASN
jgi:murein DD-endopeptidase MepM/ murein hydrolase activator NlpD